MKSVLLLSWLVLSGVAKSGQPGTIGPSPLTLHSAFPEHPWKVDAKEASMWKGTFAPAVRTLLEAGLPDPVGLPYRKIAIPTGNCYSGDSGAIRTEGWMLPAKHGEPRFAIAWNGLVYPVVKDFGKADLSVTAARIMKVGDKEKAQWHDTGEARIVNPYSLNSFHCLYLTRLGYSESADYIINHRDSTLNKTPTAASFASDLAWSHYDRAVCAHMRGDPNMVLASMARAKQIAPALRKILITEGADTKLFDYWNENLQKLIPENERRLKDKVLGFLNEDAFLKKNPSVPELIRALERIQMEQIGQPGDVEFWDDPIVKALVRKGNEAVEPLLDCLESDNRLTQSVHFWRMHHPSRTVLGVHEAAIYALQDIFSKQFFVLASTGDSLSSREGDKRKHLAKAIRAEWDKYGRITGPERAFAILKDDEASSSDWCLAAKSLFQLVEYDRETGDPIPFKGPEPGEVLRGRIDPSVSDLIVKRIDGIEEGLTIRKENDRNDDPAWNRAALMVLLLDWDTARGTAVIREAIPRLVEKRAWEDDGWRSMQLLVEEAVKKTPEVLPLFEAMLWKGKAVSRDIFTIDGVLSFVCHTMDKYGSHPLMLHKPGELWISPESSWCLAKLDKRTLRSLVELWISSDFTKREPFREALIKSLGDDSICFKVGIYEPNPRSWFEEDGDGSSIHDIPKDPLFALNPAEPMPIRRMDLVAKTLLEPWGKKKSAPFEYYWPQSKRDEAITTLVKQMKTPDRGPARKSRKVKE
jgi:hypothetical protein